MGMTCCDSKALAFQILFHALLWFPSLGSPAPNDIGYFWQITDIHYDANYTLHGDPHKMCHYSPSTVHYDLGKYGDYKCDSPWSLVMSSISAMNDIHSKPDFILWTGDSVPHVDDSTLNEDKVFNIIANITQALVSQFPDTRILPSFGNHDPYPYAQMPTDDTYYYGSILNVSHWGELLPDSAVETFLKGGYYSYNVSDKLKVICVNSALYHKTNNITLVGDDPSAQFVWLQSELEASRLAQQQVYIAAHIPPGGFEWEPLILWFHQPLNAKYLDIIGNYNEVVTAHFYGHEHTDAMRVFDSNDVQSPMFLSPAVTPWMDPWIPALYNNPSIRLYTYNRDSSELIDYYQYYLNLTKANNGGTAKWELEYQFTKAYGVENLSGPEVLQAVDKIVADNSTEYLDKYLKYNTVSTHDIVPCESACVQYHRCAMLHLRLPQIQLCLKSASYNHTLPTNSGSGHHTFSLFTTVSLICLFALAVVIVAVLAVKSKQRRFVPQQSSYRKVQNYEYDA